MEAIVVKVLKKYFKLFVKNFSPEQLSVYATKGEGQLSDLELNEAVIQELLYIPMNLAVTKASCDLLTLKIPYTSLSSKPVTLTLNRVDIDLREPETISPPHQSLKKFNKDKKKTDKKPSDKGGRNDLMDNAQLIVNNVHITVQTLGGSLVMIDLDDIVIQSVNKEWNVVDLGQSRTVDKEQGLEFLYKKLTVKSITMALLTEKSAHMILQQMPLRINLTQKRRLKDAALLGAEIEFVLEDVKFRWTRPEWLLIVDLARGFQQCLARPVPEAPKEEITAPSTPTSTSTPLSPNLSSSAGVPPAPVTPDVSFKIRLDKWAFDFVESVESDQGYSFFGQGLTTVFNSAKTNIQRVPSMDKSSEMISTEVQETVISILINTVNFRELVARNSLLPFVVSAKDATGNNSTAAPGQHLLKGNFILRRPTEVDSSSKYIPLIGIELALALSNLQIVADRHVWKALIKFLSIPKTPEEKEKEKKAEEEKKEAEKGEKKEDTLTAAQHNLAKLKDTLKLGEDWFNQIKLNVQASDIRLVLPQETKGIYQNVSLHLDLGNFTMGNFSDWKVTPNLQKGIAILAAPSPAPPMSTPKIVGIPQKLTFSIEGVGIALHSSGRVANILAPTGVKLFFHYFEREQKNEEKGKPNLEVIFQSGEFNLQANEQQLNYLMFVGRKYLNPRKIKAALSAQVNSAKEAAKEKIKEKVDEFQKSVPKEDMVTPIKEKVTNTLDAYKWIVYIHFNKGVFRVPLQFLLADDAPEPAAAEAKPAVVSNPLFDAEEVSPVKQPSFEELLGTNSKDLCEVKYDGMDLAFENNMNGQGVVVQLGQFQATGLDHPKLPSIITLLPLKITDEDKPMESVDSLVFRYKRRRKTTGAAAETTNADDDFVTEVWFRLQGMQVKISSKPNHPGIKLGMGLPDIQALVNKAVNLIQERKSDIEVLRKNAEQIKFDLKWGVEVGNCEVLLEEIDKATGTYKPYGTVRLADAQRQSLSKNYLDVEGQLIKAKTSLIMKENEREEMLTKIASLQSALVTLEDDKLIKLKKIDEDFKALEAKFVEAKVSIAQHQMENDNLKSQVTRLSKK